MNILSMDECSLNPEACAQQGFGTPHSAASLKAITPLTSYVA